MEISIQRRKRKLQKVRGEPFSDARDLLVEILAFCLMPNHIHLLIRQLKDNGISQFMRKFGAGYAAYFNKKYKRMGHLFQGRFHAIHIKNDRQLMTVFVYIHANPISLIEPNWKELGIKNSKAVLKFIESYKWASYGDYLWENNFPSVTQRDFISGLMDGKNGCRNIVNGWVEHKRKLTDWDIVGIE